MNKLLSMFALAATTALSVAENNAYAQNKKPQTSVGIIENLAEVNDGEKMLSLNLAVSEGKTKDTLSVTPDKNGNGTVVLSYDKNKKLGLTLLYANKEYVLPKRGADNLYHIPNASDTAVSWINMRNRKLNSEQVQNKVKVTSLTHK